MDVIHLLFEKSKGINIACIIAILPNFVLLTAILILVCK